MKRNKLNRGLEKMGQKDIRKQT